MKFKYGFDTECRECRKLLKHYGFAYACQRHIKKDNIEEIQKDFDLAFSEYWYHRKSLSEKLSDSMTDEHKICAKFFEVLNDLGLLDKVYKHSKIDGVRK